MAGWVTEVGGAKARHKGKSRGWLLVVTGMGAVQRSGGAPRTKWKNIGIDLLLVSWKEELEPVWYL